MLVDKLAVQMYTLRDFTKTKEDLVDTLKKIKAMGYSALQLSAIGAMNGDAPSVSPKEMKALLDEYGLACIATHRDWNNLAKETDAEIEFHKIMDCSYVAIGSLPLRYEKANAEGYRRFLDEAKPVIEKLKQAGIQYGHHNHAHEFRREEGKRTTLYDIFIEEGGSDFMLEVDTYWIQHGGFDPADIFERLHDRMPVIHIKDKEIRKEEGPTFAAIGEGNLDWKKIFEKAEAANVKWYAIEQDKCYRDPFDCLKSSHDFVKNFE